MYLASTQPPPPPIVRTSVRCHLHFQPRGKIVIFWYNVRFGITEKRLCIRKTNNLDTGTVIHTGTMIPYPTTVIKEFFKNHTTPFSWSFIRRILIPYPQVGFGFGNPDQRKLKVHLVQLICHRDRSTLLVPNLYLPTYNCTNVQ
jgi:hypothetical protein